MQEEKRKTVARITDNIKYLDMNSLILVKNAIDVLKAFHILEKSSNPNGEPKETA